VYQVENAFTQLETYSVAVADFVIEKWSLTYQLNKRECHITLI
jgi:hypothetical protein